MKFFLGSRFNFLHDTVKDTIKLFVSGSYRLIPGNKSLVIPKNKGTSLDVNLGILTSIKALITTKSSSISGINLLYYPAPTNTALRPLIPKSQWYYDESYSDESFRD